MRIAAIARCARQQGIKGLSGRRRREVECDDASIRQILGELRQDRREAFFQHQHLHRCV